MFTEIRGARFKSWAAIGPHAGPKSSAAPDNQLPEDESGISLAPVTAFFGTNSSGKTSLLQVLLLLRQTVESADPSLPLNLGDERAAVQLGTFTDIQHNHEQGAEVCLGVSWKLPKAKKFADPVTENKTLFEARDFSFDTALGQRRRRTIGVERLRYIADNNRVTFARAPKEKDGFRLEAVVNGSSSYLKRMVGRKWPIPEPVKCYGFPDQVNAYFQNAGFVSEIELEFEQQLGRTFYLGPLREEPRRDYTWTGVRPRDVGPSGAAAVPALLAAQLVGEKLNYRKRLANGRRSKLITVEEHVAAWLKELGLVHSFKVEALAEGANIYRVYVKRTSESTEVLLTDVGFGVSQILPVLVLLAYVPEGSTVVLEQPEIHLHPKAQAGLADVLLEAATVRNVQVLVESHSEHLLRRLQLRVAEQRLDSGVEISAEDVRLWFVDQAGGASRAHDLELNLLGEIVNWPEHFFGDPFGETARLAKAARRRRAELDATV